MSDTEAQVAPQVMPFVRDRMIEASAPPIREAGAVRWLRENLFSSLFNTILTLVGIAAIVWLVREFWPWLSHGVWNASSLNECRTTIVERYGEGATGACWAVINERWSQFIFGFYPSALYWRPVLTFGLLFVALAPLLFSDSRRSRLIVIGIAAVLTVWAMDALNAPTGWLTVAALAFMGAWLLSDRRPSWLLVFSILYLPLAIWLLWGGSFWTLLLALAGVVVAAGVWLLLARVSAILGVIGVVLTLAVWWLWLGGEIADALQSAIPLSIRSVPSDNFGGFLLSITIGVSGIAMSLPLGIVLALGRTSNLPLVKAFAVMFIEFIRGVPLITLLFVASLLLNYFLPPGTNFDIILRVIIMVTLFASAYMAEVIRGGLAALPRGQYEAADSLGLDYWKAQRLIILPQALKISIPGIVSSFISMFKDTTLVTFVGLFDPLKSMADSVRASIEWKGTYWEPYIFTGTIFFLICFGMSRYSMHLERRLKRDHR